MAQGSLKKIAKPKQKGGREKKGITKKGARKVAPKKASVIKQRSLDKKLTAEINRKIEKQMSVKANAVGKLTIMKKLAEDTSAEEKKKKKK
ncbi:hypothetical protein BDF20DRAFT_910636 [Mycotypha africana]|uniref:uncharacterized protein n=1 Tax=Mycotypha africana TaxID=64632 RepID=UPI0023018669|nr:uncharacterized protein BDF20DRAFT_910636 [Mycotypha africana]KAI8988097.1 hypothetical protein BDF20DRAFT_910636 [Mycotypha africana]